MKLHLEPDLFVELIEKTAEKYQIREQFIEKDYWVTYALKNLSKSEFQDQ